MTQHSSMLWLPEALEQAGVNVIEMVDWETAQGDYLWTDPYSGHQSYSEHPSCYMIHHTAGTVATPVVQTDSGQWSKANCWAGLWRDGKLYQEGEGVPTVVFTAAGPARVSSGYGYWPTALEVFDDVRVPWRQTFPDGDHALNRYAWNVETVARGDGSDIDPGVEEALTIMGVLMCERFGWSPWRTIGHTTWSVRKIDPYWQSEQDRIVAIQDAVAELMEAPDMGMDLERYATRWRNPQDFDAAAAKGLITDAEARYWMTVPTDSPEWQDLRDAVLVRAPLWS